MTLRWSPGKLTLRKDYIGTDDPDAAAYIAAVEAADGEALGTDVQVAIHSFVKGCKNDGIWDAIKASCILAGARTLAGALVPLVGTAPTSYNFVAGDYDRETGLVGDASTKYLDSNRNNNADPQNNQHMSVWVSTAATSTASTYPIYIGGGVLGVGATHIGRLNSNGAIYSRNRYVNNQDASPGSAVGLIGMSRNSSSSYTLRLGGANTSFTVTSQTPFNQNVIVFAGNNDPGRPSNARLAFYSIGESLDLALLDARVTDLINAIGAAIP
jgi:hypothetical protein